MRASRLLLAVLLLVAARGRVFAGDDAPAAAVAKKVVLIAGPKSHGPVGNGIHDYPWSVKLLKVMLDNSNVAGRVRVEYHFDGWPADVATLDDADAILVVSDGRDGDAYAEAPHFASEEHLKAVEKQVRRGCGFLTFHFSTFAPDKYADRILDWSGGYFDWETDGKRQWYSKIETREAEVRPASPGHPVLRGVTPFRMKEEFYFDIRFRPDDPKLTPILTVPDLPGREPDGRVVAWAREREEGGRGFGTTCGHFYENWKNENFRRMVLNALVWAAKAEVPEGGVSARYYTHEEITAALAGAGEGGRAVVDDKVIKALILTGAQHPAHLWRDTTPAIKEVLERDPRMKVDVSENVEDLATEKVRGYDLLVLNYCNWERPGLSEGAKAGFVRYLSEGGGLCLVHFANGAFHFSLPGAGDSDWPEYRKICRRVWDHTPGKSGHDAYGPFTVEIENAAHPVTRGLGPFRTTDELYFRQQGDEPIEVLAKAHSKVTDRWEPMAFVYEYGKGRVLQTVLGHSAESIRNPGTAAILRRGAAWVAKREPAADVRLKPEEGKAVSRSRLGEGKFGAALDAKPGGLFVAGREEYRLPPLTVECWAKVEDRSPYNILVAQEPKASATHWELFGMAGSGHLTAYLPGMTPDHVRSTADLCDGEWHYVAMVYEPRRVRLFLDGKTVADQVVEPKGGGTVTGPLAFGTLATGELSCAGAIDEVRISKGIREITSLPEKPFEADAATVGLWRFDAASEDGAVKDESRLKSDAKPERPAAAPPQTSKIGGHWGEEAVGVRWAESDSIDSRWDKTQVGPFLASIVPLPGRKPVRKGLSVKVGERGEAAVCYDTANAAMRAGWKGGFLKFDPARYGLIGPPRPAGEFVFTADEQAGWEGREVRYRGLRRHGGRVVLEATIDRVDLRESPWTESHGGEMAVTRTIELGPSDQVLSLTLFEGREARVADVAGRRVVTAEQNGHVIAAAVVGPAGVLPEAMGGSKAVVTVTPKNAVRRFKVLLWSGPRERLAAFGELVAVSPPAEDLEPLTRPGPALWTEAIETKGVLGRDDGPYAVDTLTLPFENPYDALFFVGGHDFLPNGDIALCTAHGDVWVVSGVDVKLSRLSWKRFATGLFQPLGLKVVDGVVHVLGRDQITRLRDENGDGEADRYECLSNLHETSAGGHDYVAGLETDAEGNFYFVHATQGLVRVSPDGKKLEVVATGFRNPNGLSVGPDGTMTVAPQEGEWTPGSCVIQVREGGHYGYLGPKVTPDRPLGYDLPLCWIPRRQDNSSGGQVWVTSDRWGPFAGQLLHLSYGQCRMMLVLREEVEGQVQGGVVDFPFDFESGVMRGRFSPRDGQLYVSGLKGWVSAAVKDGCLQRVRYTGKPVDFPVAAKTMRNGLALTFTRPLDPTAAENPGRYRIEQWNLRYGPQYGSPEYRPSKPEEEGRDEVEVTSATLLDERTVVLEIPDLKPVNQMTVRYALAAADGTAIRQTLAYTIHRIGSETMNPDRLRRPVRLADQPDEGGLQSGVAVRFERAGRSDARSQRLVALHVPAGRSPTPFLEPGTFAATFEGWVQVPLRGDYEFAVEGAGSVHLAINGRDVLRGALPVRSSKRVSLEKGYNRLALRYESLPDGGGSVRLLWKSEDFPEEPVPPAALFHQFGENLAAGDRLRRGRELFAGLQCARCHGDGKAVASGAIAEARRQAPDLRDVGRRLDAKWVAGWLLDPRSFRHDATMPRLFGAEREAGRQRAADVAAYLTSLGGPGEAAGGEDGAADDGRDLYADLGCIGCHRLTPPSEADEQGRISLAFAGAKYRPGALAEFLRRPQTRHVGSRMPDFGLSETEAAALAAFLRREGSSPPADNLDTQAGDASRGRELFQSLRCGRCHDVGESGTASEALPNVVAASADRGCLAGETKPGVPDFGFSAADREALVAFVSSTGPVRPEPPEEASSRLVASLRCGACHDRDADRSPRRSLIVEETDAALAPESLPSLTWAGEKLQGEWVERLIAGRQSERARPYLKARMPAFPEYADVLAAGLAAEHGISAHVVKDSPADPQLAEVGRRLAAPQSGLDCRQCHGVGDEKPLGDARTLIAPGINFSLTRDRLRHDYYSRFVLDPPRYEIDTKMPKLAPDGRTTKVRDVYDGDAARQFEAVWQYIRSAPPR